MGTYEGFDTGNDEDVFAKFRREVVDLIDGMSEEDDE
jgi:hypothetical protein